MGAARAGPEGAIVTTDAAGCQVENAALIRERGRSLIAVKGNRPTVQAAIERAVEGDCGGGGTTRTRRSRAGTGGTRGGFKSDTVYRPRRNGNPGVIGGADSGWDGSDDGSERLGLRTGDSADDWRRADRSL